MHEWWIEKIEGLKRDARLSDVTLARRLDISPAMLAHVRMGRRALPLHARLRLLDALGRGEADAAQAILHAHIDSACVRLLQYLKSAPDYR